MNDRYDVLIVGGRCAGSAAAIALGRAGYSVLLVERLVMPSETLSTHVLWPDGVAALAKLGVLDMVLEAGAPPVPMFRNVQDGEAIDTALDPYQGYDYLLCPRRHKLDGILFEAAGATDGVDAVDLCRLLDLIVEDGRVTGGRLIKDAVTHIVHADLVIGADGRDSTVAKAVGSKEHDVVDPARYWYYGYFRGATAESPPVAIYSGADTAAVFTMPSDNGLQMVTYGAFLDDFQEFRMDVEKNFLERIMTLDCVPELLAGASLALPVKGFPRVRGYYRDMHGPGWVLIGDAAHQKDPIVARGINDAFLGALDLGKQLAGGVTQDGLEAYAAGVRERTAATSQLARMMARPDQHMSADQAETLVNETSTPEGLRRYLGMEYGLIGFDDYFVTVRDGVVE